MTDSQQVLMVVEVGLVAALLDNELPPSEASALATAIRLLPGLTSLSDAQVNELLLHAGARTTQGDSWLCEVARNLTNPALRRVAFRMAAMFCSWDGRLDDKELGYLDFLARAFQFGEDEARQLFVEATS